jgi:hypothetical protein
MTSIKDGTNWRPARLVPFNAVTTMQSARSGHVQVVIVTEYDNLCDLNTALVEEGTVYCARLILNRDDGPEGQVRTLREVTPYVLGRGGVVSIAPLHFRINAAEVASALFDFDWGGSEEEGGE